MNTAFYSHSAVYGPTTKELIGPLSLVTPRGAEQVTVGGVRREMNFALMLLTILIPIGVGPLAIGVLDRVTGLFTSTMFQDVRTPSIAGMGSAIPTSPESRMAFPTVQTSGVAPAASGVTATAVPPESESNPRPAVRPNPPTNLRVF